MKYICLGYFDKAKHEGMTDQEAAISDGPWGFTNQGFPLTLRLAPKAQSYCHPDL